jgi:2-oxoglutarate dehydrogenase E1 component
MPEVGSVSTVLNRAGEDWPSSLSLPFVEQLYSDFVRDPASVPQDWRAYFSRLHTGDGRQAESRVGPSFRPFSIFNPPQGPQTNGHALATGGVNGAVKTDAAVKQDRVNQLIREFRIRGHFVARIDPLGQPRAEQPELDPANFGFEPGDLQRTFSCEHFASERMELRKIIERLQEIYCQSIGYQYMHIDEPRIRKWLTERIETPAHRLKLSRREQIRIYTKLATAVEFERFMQRKWQGAKTFSLEGGESLIPLLDLLIEHSADAGVKEIVFGMAHRGRLNVLSSILQKGYADIFKELEDYEPEKYRGRGDVKYHLGYSSDYKTAGGRDVHMSLCFNPSHLEYVNPVVLGRVRAKQDRMGDTERKGTLAVQIHGDAAFIGEGVVQETLNLSELKSYDVGGSIHIIINNQIGFTTLPTEAMSSHYNTDIARMLQIPIFHVNGENPEAVAQVVKLACDFRTTFRKDVIIDMYCYRRKGHNEQDEPRFTQPGMYSRIDANPSVHEAYLENLVMQGGITVEESEGLLLPLRENLERSFTEARKHEPRKKAEDFGGVWRGYRGGEIDTDEKVETAIPGDTFKSLLEATTRVPENFQSHPVTQRLFNNRLEMADGRKPLDWSAGEALAFASLLVQGKRVRMSGQDAERGTFSHRHAMLHDQKEGRKWMPLQHLAKNQAPCEIYNSTLSENGVLGFEYGYSLDCPNGLVIWEAQFGDFCNVAQVVIDQFIISAEEKWGRLSGVVMLLPHGFEGAGPEHSSARLERFLNLAAEDNILVQNLTTPAQIFHSLRRQALWSMRKPLVIMSPKSLLRNPAAVSPKEEFTKGSFRTVIPEVESIDPAGVRKVILCSGKVYYDLVAERTAKNRRDVAIIRLEQLYPLPFREIERTLAPYRAGVPTVWVQEEPSNMGAWWSIAIRLAPKLAARNPMSVVAREESASPATGSPAAHKLEQAALLQQAFE